MGGARQERPLSHQARGAGGRRSRLLYERTSFEQPDVATLPPRAEKQQFSICFYFQEKYDIINLNFFAAELRRPSALQELRWLRQKLRSDAARHAQDIVPDTLFAVRNCLLDCGAGRLSLAASITVFPQYTESPAEPAAQPAQRRNAQRAALTGSRWSRSRGRTPARTSHGMPRLGENQIEN